MILFSGLIADVLNYLLIVQRSAEMNKESEIYLAGGCFWGMEKLMSSIPGVISVTSGYANGNKSDLTYREVCSGTTHAREAVHVLFDREKVSLETLLYAFFAVIDPSARNRQGNDVGEQYQTGVYYENEEDARICEKVFRTVRDREPVSFTELKPIESFCEAEDYHQRYLEKNPGGYCHISPKKIREAAGIRIDAAGYTKPSDEEIRKTLTPEQYHVTQEEGTEPAFSHPYGQQDKKGLYVDVVTGEPLFTSMDKYRSSCGWPAFSKPIDENVLVQHEDRSCCLLRTEIKSRVGGSHLGHVFYDDPEAPGGTHYCIDGASIRFVPFEKMEEEGYGDLKELFR